MPLGTTRPVRQFVEGHVFPAVLMEIMSRREAYFNGFPAAQRGALSPELMARGCEIGGSISISF